MAETTADIETGYGWAWSRVSWGAILAGTIVALATYLALNLLGVGIGASTIDARQADTPSATAFGIGAAIWSMLSGLIALFAGGWVAGRLALVPSRLDRALHGVVVWAALNLLVFYLLTSAVGRIVGGAASVVGGGLSGAGQALLSQVGQGDSGAGQLIQGIAGTPEQRANVVSALREYLSQRSPEARSRLAQALGTTGMSQDAAEQAIGRWEQQAPAARERAAEAADAAASATSRASLWLFVSMLLGAAAGAWGGSVAKRPEYLAARGEAGRWTRERAA